MGGWVKQKQIKEGTYYNEHEVMPVSVESLYCRPQTNIAQLVNWNLSKSLKITTA